jgi:hypothetical protein
MTEKRGLTPRFFVAARLHCRRRVTCYMDRMFLDQITAARIVLDDRSRLPWRFFGRLTTAALTA